MRAIYPLQWVVPAFIVLNAALVFMLMPMPGRSSEVPTEVVNPQPFVLTIESVGDLIPQERRMVASAFSGKLDFLAAEGQEVEAGAVIARLNTRELEEQLQEDEMRLALLRKDAETARATAERDRQKLESEVRGARDDLALKRLELKQLESGVPASEREALALRAKAAQAAFVQAQAEFELREGLLAKGVIRPTDMADFRVSLLKAKKAHEVAATALSIARRGYPEAQVEAKRLEARKAETSLRLLEARRSHMAEVQKLEAGIAKAELDDVAARVKHRRRRMSESAIQAPGAGVVVLPSVWMNGSRKKVQVGDEVRRNAAFMEIADVSRVLIRTDIKETDIGRVRPGLPVAIRVESVKETFEGRLQSIGVLATEQKGLVNRDGAPKVFEALVATEARSEAFKPGMTVDLTITAKTVEQALTVPREAVFMAAGKPHIYVKGASGAEKRAIEAGEDDGKRVLVLSGLKAGESVLLERPR